MARKIDINVDFDKLENNHVLAFIKKLLQNADECYIWWNPLGNYVSYNNGGTWSFLICRKYIKIKGLDIFNQKEIDEAINFLPQVR